MPVWRLGARDGELVAVPGVGGPGQEVTHVAGATTGGEPLVDVGLAAAGEVFFAASQVRKPAVALIFSRAWAV